MSALPAIPAGAGANPVVFLVVGLAMILAAVSQKIEHATVFDAEVDIPRGRGSIHIEDPRR